MKFKPSLAAIALALSGALLTPAIGQADFKRICRGANLPAYRLEIKKAVKAKLEASNIAYKRVNAVFTNIKRDTDTYAPDFSTGLQVSDGAVPTVTYTGSFPSLDSCTITGKLKIIVVYENGAAITKTDVSVPGTMLFKVKLGVDGNLGTTPGAD